jgi:hypothetical protein
MTNQEAKLILKVFNNIQGSTTDEINTAYKAIPNSVLGEQFPTYKKVYAINRYATFNMDELNYAIANSNDTIQSIESEIFNMETPTPEEIADVLIPMVKEETFVDVPTPVKKKHAGGRPKKVK